MVEPARDSRERLYPGPYVAGRGGWADARWVWVANSIRPIGQVFATPGLVRDPAETVVGLLPDDRAGGDGAIDSGWHASRADPDTGNSSDAPHVGADGAELVTDAPSQPFDGSGTVVEIRVLGPVEVTGWRTPPERAVVTELACFLALHRGRPIPGGELRTAFRPDEEQETSAKTLRTYMSLLRRALGPDLMPAGGGGGYRLSPAVTTDWYRFQALTGPAAGAPALREGLSLVRGRPFTGVPSGTFGWVYTELLVSDMEVAIADAARRLADEALTTGDLNTATWATRQGLAGVPMDIGLWQLHLAVARRRGTTFLDRARRDAEAALGADARDLIDGPGRPAT